MMKYLHVLLAVSLLGIHLASHFYIATSLYIGNRALSQYTLRFSLLSDVLTASIIFILFLSASHLMTAQQLSLAVPWIQAAYLLLSISTFCWLKLINTKRTLKVKNLAQCQPPFSFHMYYILMMLVLICIIHDAVMKQTFLL